MQRIGLTLALVGMLTSQASFASTPPAAAEFARYAEDLLTDAYEVNGPGVAVLVMRGDEVLYRGAHGEADVATDVPVRPGDRFRIGSITKQIAAAGLLTLVDAGRISLEDPLSKHLPDYPGGSGITIEQLLNHTSGIKSYLDIPGTMDDAIKRDVTTAQLVNYFKKEPPDFAPGESWRYSDSGYVLVGAVIEAVSSEPWHQYLDRVLFKPLGMKDTGYGADPKVVARQVKGHTTEGHVPGNAPEPAEQISMTQPHAAGALVSTVDDLARWNRALHEGRVVKPATYARMITPVRQANEAGYAYGYGYGIEIAKVRDTPALQYDGGIAGFSSHLSYMPGPDITVAVLHNSDTPSRAQETRPVARRLAAAALGQPYPAVIPVPVELGTLREYEGVYRVDEDATRTLRVVDGKLTVLRTNRAREDLTAIADDTFLYPDGFNRLRVERDSRGRISGMRFWAEGEGVGTFAPRTDEPLPVAVTLAPEALERLAGAYAAGGVELSIVVDGGGLSGYIKGEPRAVSFVPITPLRFTADAVGAELAFTPEAGPAQSVTLRQFGDTIIFKRVPAEE